MASPTAVPPDSVQIAQQSYQRCQRATEFFQVLYQRLLASHETIPPKFANTDFDRQNRLLQHGLGLLLSYASRRDATLLQRIAERHSRRDLKVDPDLYPLFVESLVATVKEFDLAWSPEVERAWRKAMIPGIEFMQSLY